MIDDFINRYKWLVGGVLIFVIVAGIGLIWWDKTKGANKVQENQEIAELKNQNELLREQLSSQASQQVAGVTDEADESDKININSATAEELDTLPNIGPVRAADIIAYREANGGFKTIEEIKNIKGIGDKSFEDMKDLITMGE